MSEFIIEDGILKKYIGNDEMVIIPDGVEQIGEYAFCHCKSIVRISVPKTVKIINEHAFHGCWSIKKVDITDIAAWCAIDCESDDLGVIALYLNGELISDLIIPYGVTSIGARCFKGCRSIKKVTIPDTLKKIGKDAFKTLGNIEEIHISDIAAWCGIDFGVGNFETKRLFINGAPLHRVNIPYGVEYIGECFNGCVDITDITIPESVTKIAWYAFENCSSLQTLVLPSGLKEISCNSFVNCRSLSAIVLADGAETTFYKCRFDGCPVTTERTSSFLKGLRSLWTLCSEEDAELTVVSRQNGESVFLRYSQYSADEFDIIYRQASEWKISVFKGGNIEPDSYPVGEFDILANRIVADNGNFAGVIECEDGNPCIKWITDKKVACVALIKDWKGTPIECSKTDESYREFDYGATQFGTLVEKFNTRYLVKKEGM